MTRPDRPDLSDADEGRVREIWSSMGEDDDREPVDAIFDRHWLAVSQEHGTPDQLPRWLDLRVRGPRVNPGRIDTVLAENLIHAYASEWKGAAEARSISKPPSLELTGIGRGSAILHLAPLDEEAPPEEGQLDVALDQTDTIVAIIAELHSLAESGGDLRYFHNHPSLLRGLREIVNVLDQHDVELDMHWRSGTGVHRTSSLTASGRENVRRAWEDQTQTHEKIVSGRVLTLGLKDEGGSFEIKTGTTRTSARYCINATEATLRAIELGETYTVRVTETSRTNKAGLAFDSRYDFIAFEQHQPLYE